MTFCINCGKNLRAGTTQCDACGAVTSAVSPSLSDAPTSPNLDAEKTQISTPTDISASTGASTSARGALPVSATVGAQTGRLLGGRYKLEEMLRYSVESTPEERVFHGRDECRPSTNAA